ncbi:MAG: hypothetical protein ACYC8W_06160 [Candidatus Tyrphobacter sp.]
MRNRLLASVEPFAEVVRCIVCADQVEIESDMNYAGTAVISGPVDGASLKCENCGEYLHATCAVDNLCASCSTCAECYAPGTISVIARTALPESGRGGRTELVCRVCYIGRVGKELQFDGLSAGNALHRTLVIAQALRELLKGMNRSDRALIERIIAEPQPRYACCPPGEEIHA